MGTPLMEATSASLERERPLSQQTWHSPQDEETRRTITHHMCVHLFHRLSEICISEPCVFAVSMFSTSARAPDIAISCRISSRGLRMPCIKLQRAWLVLFAILSMHGSNCPIRSTFSQDEYMDLNTLETRLQDVARRYVKTNHVVNPQHQQHQLQQQQLQQQQQGAGLVNYHQHQIQATSSNPMGFNSQAGIAPQSNFIGMDQAANGQSSNGASTSSPSQQVQVKIEQSQPVGQMVPSSALGSSMPVNMLPNGAPVMLKREMNVSVRGVPGSSG